MKRTDATLSTLRSLDPADREIDPRSPRARADLARIVATDPQFAGPPGPARVEPARSPRARWLILAGGTVAVAVAAGVLLPQDNQAFASWTPSPATLAPRAAAKAAESCREQQEGVPNSADRELATARAAVTERRGDWTMVVLAGDDGFSAMCLTNDSLGLFSDAWVGSVGRPDDFTEPAPRELRATDLGSGSVARGAVSVAVGFAGGEVVGVTYPSAAHGPVEATVSGGRFALWFPGDELEDTAADGVDTEVTYRDGTSGTVTLRLR
ncbi:hypothetical protein C1I95_07885 [Micromonospora craterilacus]|uniref:Uncharacterized protein n=1 Tax=Micromonospora craterilacus TaxID=1655439 RepID=A0A2W2EFT7_9ACTN|nr:hypothetical protein [Micromonospora craterilacus]PZG21273.1 hypothetical protein C1I95_07885 [Micromonospora craterilacus]